MASRDAGLVAQGGAAHAERVLRWLIFQREMICSAGIRLSTKGLSSANSGIQNMES